MNYACDFLNLWEGDMLSPYGRWNLGLFPSTLLLLSIDALSIALIGLCIHEFHNVWCDYLPKTHWRDYNWKCKIMLMLILPFEMQCYWFQHLVPGKIMLTSNWYQMVSYHDVKLNLLRVIWYHCNIKWRHDI